MPEFLEGNADGAAMMESDEPVLTRAEPRRPDDDELDAEPEDRRGAGKETQPEGATNTVTDPQDERNAKDWTPDVLETEAERRETGDESQETRNGRRGTRNGRRGTGDKRRDDNRGNEETRSEGRRTRE